MYLRFSTILRILEEIQVKCDGYHIYEIKSDDYEDIRIFIDMVYHYTFLIHADFIIGELDIELDDINASPTIIKVKRLTYGGEFLLSLFKNPKAIKYVKDILEKKFNTSIEKDYAIAHYYFNGNDIVDVGKSDNIMKRLYKKILSIFMIK